MRTLLVNPELPVCFWTFKEAYELNGVKAMAPPLGLITIAALLPTEWELRLVDMNTRTLTEEDWEWAELVMFSAMLVQRESLLALIREAKRRGKATVAGGPYPTSVPEEILDAGVDFLVRGEAEDTMASFLFALEKGTKRQVFEEPIKPDLTKSPVPRFDLLRFEDYATLAIQTSRGCPFECEFCDVVNLYGHKTRHKTPDQVLKELEVLYSLGWRREVFVCDDNFVGDKKHAHAILHRLIPWMKKHGEPFTFATQASVNLGQDIDLINLLTEANISRIIVGVESPDEKVLALTRKHQNIRHPLTESLRNMNRNGLTVIGSFIIGFDQESEGAGDRICEFVEELGIPLVTVNILSPLPNTRLWERLKREGRLCEDTKDGSFMSKKLNYVPTRPESQIIGEYLLAMNRLYEPSAYLRRAYRYFLAMRPTRLALARQKGEIVPSLAPIEPVDSSKKMIEEPSGTAKFFWRQGVYSRNRFQFWRQLLGMYRKNPSRVISYLLICSLGEDLFRFREIAHRQMTSNGKDR
jgi:radical SAM superfamily enzyme YgiQ (UPF0313 family)